MLSTVNQPKLISLFCLSFLLASCANHLPPRNEHEDRIERVLLSHELQIDAGAAALELPRRRVRVVEQQTFEATHFSVTRTYERYTPYQGWREVYEIPLGAIAVVAGIGANIVNIAALGRLPERVTRGWINYGIDGLNPVMNVESNGRAQQNLDRKSTRLNSSHVRISYAVFCLKKKTLSELAFCRRIQERGQTSAPGRDRLHPRRRLQPYRGGQPPLCEPVGTRDRPPVLLPIAQ